MKFTKEQLLEKLKQELTNGGKKPLRMSERTLAGQAETLMSFAGEETELDDFVKQTKPMFESVNSNMEHDIAEFIADYKTKNPAPKPAATNPDDKDDPNKALLERLEALEKLESERNAKVAIETKRKELADYLAQNKVEDKEWIEKMLAITTIGADDDIEAKGKSLLDVYNISRKANPTITPGSPTSGDPGASDPFSNLKEMRRIRSGQEVK